MRFLLDHALSPLMAEELRKAGHDVIHVADYGIKTDSDRSVLEFACRECRTLVTTDADFAYLLADVQAEQGPSLVLLAPSVTHRTRERAQLFLRWLPSIREALGRGSMAILEPFRVRVWRLPLALKFARA